MKTKVEVTADDIALGSRCNGWNCPVHRGLWRATGQSWNVYNSWAIAVEPQPRRTISLPSEAIAFNNRFDAGLPVLPFTFEVDIPEGKCGNEKKSARCCSCSKATMWLRPMRFARGAPNVFAWARTSGTTARLQKPCAAPIPWTWNAHETRRPAMPLSPTKYKLRLDSYQDSRPEEVVTLTQETQGSKLEIRMPLQVATTIHDLLGAVLKARIAPAEFEIVDAPSCFLNVEIR